ncbi:MAG TPA: glycosyltransferase family 4 protein [bacterium]
MKSVHRIAVLTNYPSDFTGFSGGVETVTSYLLEGLDGHYPEIEFHIVSLSRTIKSDQHLVKNGFRFHFLAVSANPLLKPHTPYNIARCVLLLKKIKPDLVHCQDNVALALAAVIGGYPRIFTVHGIRRTEAKLWIGNTYWSHQLDRVIEWFVHRNYRYFIGASPYVANLLSRRKRVFILPNPISEQFFAGDPAAVHAANEILFIGAIIHLKQVHVLIDAYAKLKREFHDIRLNVCGRKDDMEYYQNLMNAIHASVHAHVSFFHDLPSSGIKDLLATAAVFILPSIQENSPMTIAEAMAAGVPVVASRVGGIPYMIEHGRTGLLFSAGDADELAACIKTLLVDKELADRIRRNARQHAMDNYRCRDIARRHIAIYREIMDRAP